MLSQLKLADLAGGIRLIDLGSSGKLDAYWEPLESFLNLYAFDPNVEECQRLAKLPHQFASATYVPAAIAGQKGEYVLYKTKSIYCWSLLEPNTRWLKRFSFHDLFHVEATAPIAALALDDVPQLSGVRVDAIKCDTQGLELPIMRGAARQVQSAFLIETETGFVKNYLEETTFREISQFMEDNHFLLFDLNPNHRIPRNNLMAEKTRRAEMLWCEAIWLKDYVALDQQAGLTIDRPQALKALLLCANHGCLDFGFELAELFCHRKLLTQSELDSLRSPGNWALPRTRASRKWSRALGQLLAGRRE
jgi:FkbM family methyltransferase